VADAEILDDVLSTAETIIRGVRPDQYKQPTPCPAYDVGTLVNHLVGWLEVFADGANQQKPRGDPAARKVGENPAAEFHQAAELVVDAFRNGAAERGIDLGNGPSPGSMIFDMMLMEYIGHGWDLATATDQPAPYSQTAIDAACDAATAMLKPEYRGSDKPFGDVVPVPAGAPPLDRLVGLLGRTPASAG
jgi:uncharacterized protein (TIGR03086 family)